MKKNIQYLFSEEKWIAYTLVGVFFLLLCHMLLFFGHQFFVYRYDTLYDEATKEGAVVIMPDGFQEARGSAHDRIFLTRPDILIGEAMTLERGIQSLMNQYRHDFYRMHDTITANIASLRTIIDQSATTIFPEREKFIQLANSLESKIMTHNSDRDETLEELVALSHQYVLDASYSFEQTKKTLVLQDITSLENEIIYLDSIFRVTSGTVLIFDTQIFNALFQKSFSPKELGNNSDTLRSRWLSLSELLDPYRVESQMIRQLAREKRADIVLQEAKKWIDSPPPVAPFPNIYSQIYVSLREQMMFVYEDGDLIYSTSITSGRQNFETVRGTFKIYTKQRNKLMKSPFPGEDYELWVDYWMGFTGAYGIHDACNSRDCWRTKFGGANYVYNGSHGCINTPYKAVVFIYNWARIGTTVHVK